MLVLKAVTVKHSGANAIYGVNGTETIHGPPRAAPIDAMVATVAPHAAFKCQADEGQRVILLWRKRIDSI